MANYQSKYSDEIEALKNDIASQKGFSYSPDADPAYRQYESQYQQNAQQGMKNTLAEAVSLTGGYNNSYAQVAAQREYDRIVGQLGSVIPELYNAAYERYRDEISDKYERLSALTKLDDADYSKWRDSEDDRVALYINSENNRHEKELAEADNSLERELAYDKNALERELAYSKNDLERDLAYNKNAIEIEKNKNDYELEKKKNDRDYIVQRKKVEQDKLIDRSENPGYYFDAWY